METIHTVLEADFKGELSQEDHKELFENILGLGEGIQDAHKHYDKLFIDGLNRCLTRFYEKYRGELQPSYEHISDKVLVVLLTENLAHGRVDVYRNDNTFAIEVEID